MSSRPLSNQGDAALTPKLIAPILPNKVTQIEGKMANVLVENQREPDAEKAKNTNKTTARHWHPAQPSQPPRAPTHLGKNIHRSYSTIGNKSLKVKYINQSTMCKSSKMTVTDSARAADDEPSDEMNETHAHMSLNNSMLKYHSNPQPPHKHINFVNTMRKHNIKYPHGYRKTKQAKLEQKACNNWMTMQKFRAPAGMEEKAQRDPVLKKLSSKSQCNMSNRNYSQYTLYRISPQQKKGSSSNYMARRTGRESKQLVESKFVFNPAETQKTPSNYSMPSKFFMPEFNPNADSRANDSYLQVQDQLTTSRPTR